MLFNKKKRVENNTYNYICAASKRLSAICDYIPLEARRGEGATKENVENIDKLFLYAVFRAVFVNAFPPEEMFSIIKGGVQRISSDYAPSVSEYAFQVNWKHFLEIMKLVNEAGEEAAKEGIDSISSLAKLYLAFSFKDLYMDEKLPKYGKVSYEGLESQMKLFFDDFINMRIA